LFEVRNWSFAAGRPFTDVELRGGAAVCVIGETVRRNLFRAGDPVGSKIRLQDLACQVIGVLDTYKPASAGTWSPEEVALLERIVEELDPALESARLYRDTQSRAARERAIRQVTEEMRRAVDIEAILQSTVVELARALGAPRAYVRLGTEDQLLSSAGSVNTGVVDAGESREGGEADA